MRRLFNTTLKEILANKKRKRIALAIFAPLLAAVVVLTGVFSLLPALTASGPVGDVIENLPYNGITPPETIAEVLWTKVVDHPRYDSAYSKGAETNPANVRPEDELAYSLHSGTSGFYNGVPTPNHVVFGPGFRPIRDGNGNLTGREESPNCITFFGYEEPQYMDYCFSEYYSDFTGCSFTLRPVSMIFHTFYQSGFLFNGTMSGGKYTGYALILECGNTEGMLTTGTASLKLYYINNEPWKTENFNPGDVTNTRTLIATVKTGIQNYSTTPFRVSMERNPGNGAFKLYVDGVLVANVTNPQSAADGFGFFTGYYAHSCPILSIIRYEGVQIDAIPKVFDPVQSTVYFMRYNDNGTFTEIRTPETEEGMPGQWYKVKQPETIEYEGEIYTLYKNSRKAPISRDIMLRYEFEDSDNETTLYYAKDDGMNLAFYDDMEKNARVNDDDWDIGNPDPVEVFAGDTVEYSLKKGKKISPATPVPTLALRQYSSTDLYNSNENADNIESVTAVSLPKNYTSLDDFKSDYGGVWNGKNIKFAWDATYGGPSLVSNPTAVNKAQLAAATYNDSTILSGYLSGINPVGLSYSSITPYSTNIYSSSTYDTLAILKQPLNGNAVPDTIEWTGYKDTNNNIVFLYTNGAWEQIGTVTATSNTLHKWALSPSQQAGVTGPDLYIAFYSNYVSGSYTGIYNGSTTPFYGFPVITSSALSANPVIAWTTEASAGKYNLFIGGEGGVWMSDDPNAGGQFRGFIYAKTFDLKHFHTERAVSMEMMFGECLVATSINVSSFDTSNVTNMSYMFYMCRLMTGIDLSGFDTSQVTDMTSMFWQFGVNTTGAVALDLRSFDTSNVVHMSEMFNECGPQSSAGSRLLTLNLSSFDTSKVQSMSAMFQACKALRTLDISNFDTSSVKYMCQMFTDCTALTEMDVSHFNVSNLDDFYGLFVMFGSCTAMTRVDISNWGVLPSNIEAAAMFGDCKALRTLCMENTVFTFTPPSDSDNMLMGANNSSTSRLTIHVSTTGMQTLMTTIKSASYSNCNNAVVSLVTTPVAPCHTSKPAVKTPVVLKKTVTDTIPAGMTYVPNSANGVVSYDDSARTLTWTVTSWNYDLSFKVTVDAGTEGTLYNNKAETRLGGAVKWESNDAHHILKSGFPISTQYYIFDHALNDQELAPDNSLNGCTPVLVQEGDMYLYNAAHAPASLLSHSYYGYQYIDPADDPDKANPGAIHRGRPPLVLFDDVDDSKTIRYYYTTVSENPKVAVYFVKEDGSQLTAPIEVTVMWDGNYSMPARYLDSINLGGTVWNFYDSTLTAPTAPHPTVGNQPDRSILQNAPQFTGIQGDKAITLYFTDTPMVTVNYLEYLNESNVLKDSNSYLESYFAQDGTFTIDPSMFDDITKNGKLYYYADRWSRDNLDSGAMKTGKPGTFPVTENIELNLYFSTDYTVTEKFHPVDAASCCCGHDEKLQADILRHIPGGGSYTGNPPAEIEVTGTGSDHDGTWYYVGYRVGDDDSNALNYGYPPDPTIAKVNDDVAFIYVYTKTPPDPNVKKTASPGDGTEDTPVQLTVNQEFTYTIEFDSAGGRTEDFFYTGAVQPFTAPAAGDYTLEIWGAQGGNGSSTGGKGGYAAGTVTLAKNEMLYVYVGGSGANGGFNGGGTTGGGSGAGGGGTDIRRTSGDLNTRIIVAGGGGAGGSISTGTGGFGGGTTGGGSGAGGHLSYSSSGGSQTAGGSTSSSSGMAGVTGVFGGGGDGGYSSPRYGGGGGGGWYGGGGGKAGGTGSNGSGGTGGSGFVYTGNVTTPGTYKNSAAHYLKDTSNIAGNASMPDPQGGANITGNAGDGFARISFSGGSATITDLLPEGLHYVSSADGGVKDTVGSRDRVIWTNPSGTSVTVTVKVVADGKMFINTASVEMPSKTIVTNPTYHYSGILVIERFREKDNIGNILLSDRRTVRPSNTATFPLTPEEIDDWNYWGYDHNDNGDTESGKGQSVTLINGKNVITYLYDQGSDPITVPFEAIKTAVGKNMEAEQFEFGLYEIDEHGDIVLSTVYQASNDNGGLSSPVTFPALTFSAEGVYEYFLSEIAIVKNSERWKLDETRYRIKITVTEQSGALVPVIKYTTANDDGDPVDANGVVVDGEPAWTTYGTSSKPGFNNFYAGPILPSVGGSGENTFTITALAIILLASMSYCGILIARRRKRFIQLE